MTLPWNKEMPTQESLFGVQCPICHKQTHLVTMVFHEGKNYICEECRGYSSLADWYVQPKFNDFKKRVSKSKR